VSLAWGYKGGAYANVPGRSFEDDFPGFCSVIDQIIPKGKPLIIGLSGEGHEGYDWLMANFAKVIAALREGYDRTRYGVIYITYDGVWPADWTVEMMNTFLPFARQILGPDAVLAMMFAGGPAENQYLVVNGTEDWAEGGVLQQNLDIMHCSGGPSETVGESLGQIASRMLGPHFINDVDGYTGLGVDGNEDGHLWYLKVPGPRGPISWGWIEWREYEWVRGWVSADEIEQDRMRMRRAGVTNLG
jgi:hypothetical protein